MMNISLNYNRSTSNGLFELNRRDQALTKITGSIASGDKIEQTKFNPTYSRISEQIKTLQIGNGQAAKNSEIAVEHIQTAESGVETIERLLIRLKQLAVQASNEGAYSDKEISQIQMESEKIIDQIKYIAENTRFNGMPLLNGEKSVRFASRSAFLSVKQATERTASSPFEGHKITVISDAAKATLTSENEFNDESLQSSPFSITVYQHGKTTELTSQPGETAIGFIGRLNRNFNLQNMSVTASIDKDKHFQLQSAEYGSDSTFRVSSRNPDVWATDNESITEIRGTDIVAQINQTDAIGKGRMIIAREGTAEEGLEVLYDHIQQTETEKPLKFPLQGYVLVRNESIGFQLGADSEGYKAYNLNNYLPEGLGRNVDNESNIASLAKINMMDFTHAQDSMLVIDKAISEVALKRAELGAFQKDTAEKSRNHNLIAFETNADKYSNIRDTDYAKSISKRTQQDIARLANISLLQNTGNQNMMTLLT